MKKCVNSSHLLLLILCSIFVFGNQIRYGLNPHLYHVNLIFLIAIIIFFGKYRNALSEPMFILWCALSIQMVLVNLANDCTVRETLRNFAIMYLPLLLLLFNMSKTMRNYECVTRKLIKTYNFFAYLQLIIYFVDAFLNGAVIKWFANNLTPLISQYLINRKFGLFTYRFTSYLGQSLFVSEVFLIFLILNLYYNKKAAKPLCNRYFIYTISLIGVLIVASRTGTVLVIGVIALDLLYEKKKMLSMGIVVVLVFIIQFLGVFDVLIGRMSTVTLTAGRNEAWGLLKQTNALKLHLFYGSGMKTHAIWTSYIGSSKASNAFEYPIRTLFYRIGIIPALGWCYIMFIKPLISIIKKGGLLFLAVLIIDVNTFNGLSEVSDLVLLYTWVAQMMLLIADIDNENIHPNDRESIKKQAQ